jgi:alpha-L-rhamnosidase
VNSPTPIGTLTPLPWSHPVRQTPAIWHPTATRDGWAVVEFRRRFKLARALRGAVLLISASERFIARLNGGLIGRGPSRSDPLRWPCARLELGALAAGEHELSIHAFHFGDLAGKGQMGGPAFLLVCGEGRLAEAVSTTSGWQCREDLSRRPIDKPEWGGEERHSVIGAGERVTAQAGASAWVNGEVVAPIAADEWGNVPVGHVLCADPLPPMEEKCVQFARVAEAPGQLRTAAESWLSGKNPLTIPASTSVRLVLDRGEMTNAYPSLTVSRGRGAAIRLVWAEAPYGEDHSKGNRNETTGKLLFGHRDEFLPDGRAHRVFAPLWFRSFRYVELQIITGPEPLKLEEFALASTGYPLRQLAKFSAYRPLWEVSWRTAQLCAHETMFDCPHYEQCQFPGDSVVQAVYHYLVANDDRLARKAMDDFNASRLPDGMVQCRYPSRQLQIIPTFALYYIRMLHDFRLYRGDKEFLRTQLPGARMVLDWFERCLRPDGMLGHIPYAPFMDWSPGFECGNAPQDADGGSSLITLLFAQACGWQAGLETSSGFPELASRWQRRARELNRAIQARCWDPKRRLLADTPALKSFSVHVQVLGVLAGLWTKKESAVVLRRALADPSVTSIGTFYFRFYLAQAFRVAGIPGEFFGMLKRWERALEGTGLTTWPESDSPQPRSDCHAWSVTPAIEFLQTVLGVEPDPNAEGFARGLFRPALGQLDSVSGKVPTPHGTISVKLRRQPGGWVEADVESPIPLRLAPGPQILIPGKHRLTVKDNT